MNIQDYKGVYVFVQQVDSQISGVSYELLGKARELADTLNTEVGAILLGSNVEKLADSLAEYGADRVILVDSEELKEYRTEPYAHAITTIVEKYKPEIVSTETLGAEAYNVDVPINKTEAETTQLLHDIYDNSAIYSDEIDGQSNKEREKEDKDFDPKLFILYSEIAQPKFKD